jgi:undecaprenyl-diphosphatase
MPILINFLATYLIFILPVIGVCYFIVKKDRVLVVKMILALLVERILELIIKTAYFTPRPYVTNHLPTYVTILPTDSSFPSGHSMLAFAFATVIFLHFNNKKLGIFAYIIALFVGIGRVLANVHYPIDVFSGLVLGVTIGVICDKIKLYDNNKRNHSSSRRKTKK